jgi:signal transduction histidine kinase
VRVLREGRSVLVAEMTAERIRACARDDANAEAMLALGLRSYIAVPLQAHGRTLGVLSLGSVRADRVFGDDDLACAEALAERAAYALECTRMYHDMQLALSARDDFMLVAAHELRTPLTSLLLQVHTLRRRTERALAGHPAAAQIDARLEAFRGQCERLGQLIDAMLDVAAIAQEQFVLKVENVDLAAVVRGVTRQIEAAGDAQRAGCALETEVPGAVVGRWDRTRLEQLLHHLLANALKYGAGQPVQVRLAASAVQAVLTVRDSGAGIDREAQEQIFERFTRANSNRNYGGLGVGLYVARQIAEGLGGHIEVTSEPGHGATFTVTLPRVGVARPETRASSPLPLQ